MVLAKETTKSFEMKRSQSGLLMSLYRRQPHRHRRHQLCSGGPLRGGVLIGRGTQMELYL